MAQVSLQDVRKTYKSRNGEVDALQPFNLQIADGEFVTILGPSGCGKTTLLSVIVGILQPTAGRILVDGQDITNSDPRQRDMAMVFQNYALYPSKTVRGNLEFPLRMRGMAPAERLTRVEAMAELLGLTHLLKSYPRQLSGGQQQRVALGRALIRRPKLFLMDEPLSNLDAKRRMQMRQEIKRLHREVPVTTLYVTHDQSEAMALSDRVIVMNHGTVRQADSPDTIYRRPADQFVAGFVGAPAMNLIPVTLKYSGDHVSCLLASGQVAATVHPLEAPSEGEAVLGIRPGHIEWRPGEAAGEGSWLHAAVRETDETGDDTLVYADCGELSLTVMERYGRRPTLNGNIALRFPPPAVHLFIDGRRVELQEANASEEPTADQ